MRFKILLIAFIVLVSCKEKKNNEVKENNNKPLVEKVNKKISLPNISKWEAKGVIVEDYLEEYRGGDTVVKVSNNGKLSYLAVNNVKIDIVGETFKAKILVKGVEETTMFALRVQEVYPNRVDAIFNLENEKVVKTFTIGDFAENVKADIKPLENGWYECSLQADIYSNYVRIIFGGTKAIRGLKNWEANDNEKSEILILPSSLTFEELAR